jgi:hypothetical protein
VRPAYQAVIESSNRRARSSGLAGRGESFVTPMLRQRAFDERGNQGVSAEDAAKRADLTKHRAHLPINGPGVPLIGVQRIYELIDQRARR